MVMNDEENVLVDETSINTENPTVDEDNEEVVGTLEDTSNQNASTEKEVEESVEKKQEEKETKKEKTYTQEELDRIIKSRVSRLESDNARKLQEYEDLANTLRTGMGKDTKDVKELSKDLRQFYKNQGVDIPEPSRKYSDKEERILAKAEADEIINSGEDEINRIANEIYNIPQNERTTRQKAVFEALGNYMVTQKAVKELEAKGVDKSILEDNSFKEFAGKFSAKTPISDVYDMYSKINSNSTTEKKKAPPSTGSVKTTTKTQEIKEYYTPEEVSKFTMEQLKNNPKLMKAVDNSMMKWNK